MQTVLPDIDRPIVLRPGIVLLPRRADSAELLPNIARLLTEAPLRRMTVPGGKLMSVAMSNCGELGWTSDATGYRYRATDPLSGRPWPAMPAVLRALANACASAAGFDDFAPDACLINGYAPGTKLSRHRDSDEHDLTAPIVSVSLGASARFVFGGLARTAPAETVPLQDGDVLVWGGPMRLVYHGVGMPDRRTIPSSLHSHPAFASLARINLTFRRAG